MTEQNDPSLEVVVSTPKLNLTEEQKSAIKKAISERKFNLARKLFMDAIVGVAFEGKLLQTFETSLYNRIEAELKAQLDWMNE